MVQGDEASDFGWVTVLLFKACWTSTMVMAGFICDDVTELHLLNRHLSFYTISEISMYYIMFLFYYALITSASKIIFHIHICISHYCTKCPTHSLCSFCYSCHCNYKHFGISTCNHTSWYTCHLCIYMFSSCMDLMHQH